VTHATSDTRANSSSQTAADDAGRAFWLWVMPPAAVALALRVLVAATDRVPTADATAFLTAGQSLLDGDGYARYGSAEVGVPPLVPALLAALARLTRDSTTGFSVHHVLWGTALVLPVAAVARSLAGNRAGWAAAWAAALCPGLVVTAGIGGGGSELPAVVATATALALVVDRAGPPTGWRAVAVGVCCGLAYLFRADALLAAAVILLALAVRAGRSRPDQARGALLGLLVAGAAAVAVAAPWVAWVHQETGRLQLTGKASDTSIEGWAALARHDRVERDALLYRLDESGEIVRREEVSLVQLAMSDPAGFLGIQRENLTTLTEESLIPEASWDGAPVWLPPSWELVPLPGLVLAGWATWRRRSQPRVQLLVALVGANLAVTFAFFVQDRYLVPAVTVACVLIGVGLSDLQARWWRRAMAGLLVVSAALAIGAETSGPTGQLTRAEPAEHRAIGEILAETTTRQDRVMTRSMTVRYYLGRATVPFPYGEPATVLDYACRKGVDLIVVDERQVGSLRPQLASWLGPGPWDGLRLEQEITVDDRLVRVFAVQGC
jgi:4-amino-4-deoxy-L-arabinose transferase-like glycosyltransferase